MDDNEHDLRSRPAIRPLNAIEITQRVCGIDPNEIVAKLEGIAREFSDAEEPKHGHAEIVLAAHVLIALAYQPARQRHSESPRLHRARARLANSILSANAPDAVEELVRAILEAELNDNGNG